MLLDYVIAFFYFMSLILCYKIPVLSDKGERTIYDAALFGLLGDDDDEVSFLFSFSLSFSFHFDFLNAEFLEFWQQGFVDFMREMILMMQSVRPQVISLFYNINVSSHGKYAFVSVRKVFGRPARLASIFMRGR